MSVGVGRGLKLVLLARNLTLNSHAAPKYKYMLGLHSGTPFNLVCEIPQCNTYV